MNTGNRLILAIVGVLAGVLLLSVAVGSLARPGRIGAGDPEATARDASARGELTKLNAGLPFVARIPKVLPDGYLYDRVVMEPGNSSLRGFSIWMRRPLSADRGLHLIEAPEVPTAEKNTLKLPGLSPVVLANGQWMVLQKPGEPWKGLWIYVKVIGGIHIEVDGADRAGVEAVAGTL